MYLCRLCSCMLADQNILSNDSKPRNTTIGQVSEQVACLMLSHCALYLLNCVHQVL